MGLLQDLLNDGEPKNPDTKVGSSGGLIMKPRLDEPEVRKFAPASENILKETDKLFSRETTPLGRLGAAAMIPINMLGLPQEVATRVFTGNRYGTPGQIPEVRQAFTLGGRMSESAGAMFADIVLDPLNLAAGGGAAVEMFKGSLLSKPLLGKVQNFNEIRLATKKSLLFNSREEAVKLMKRADLEVPIVYNSKARLWTYDLTEHINPTAARDALNDAKKKFNIQEISKYDPATGKRDYNVMERVTGAGRKGKDVITPWDRLRTPSHLSTASKTFVQTMFDAQQARTIAMNAYNEGVKQVLYGTSMLKDPRNPLSRAMVYELAGDAATLAKDKDAVAATLKFGQVAFKQKAEQLRTIMTKQLGSIAGLELPATAQKRTGFNTIGDMIRDAMKNGTDVPLPEELIKTFAQQHKVNPNNANLKDLLQFYGLHMTKRAHIDPTVEVLSKMIGTTEDALRGAKGVRGEVKKLTGAERELMTKMLEGFKGKPTDMDASVIKWITKNADRIREAAWGQKHFAAAIAGDDLTRVNGLRGALGRGAENLIHAAEKNVYLASDASMAARNKLYTGLLGLAVDSAVRNTSALLNTITEFGVGGTLRGMGAYAMNKQWSEWLHTQNVMGRTNSFLEDMFQNTPWKTTGQKVDEFVMTPFTVSENFIRGATYITALKRAADGGVKGISTLGDALRYAEGTTRDLMFSQALTDMSPYARDPVTRLFFQFVNYPLKQTELLLEMARNGKGAKNQAVRYLINMGAAIGMANHIGIDPSEALLSGILPTNALKEGSPQAPVLGAAAETLGLVSNTAKRLFTNGGDPELETPQSAWRALGQIINYVVPGGRYSQKLTKQIIEGGILAEDYDARKTMQNHPNLIPVFEMLGVNPDPGVDAYDRFVRLIGFRSTRDVKRKDLMNFLHKFIVNLNNAKADLNEAAALGGDTEKVRARWLDHIKRTFGQKMAKMNVPWDMVETHLKPSDKESVLRKADQRTGSPWEEKQIVSYPKKIKEVLRLPNFGEDF